MEKYLPVLQKSKLFAGVDEDELGAMLGCLGARMKRYLKGAYVFHQGEHLNHLTVLVEGKLHIQKDDYWGKRSIVNAIIPGEMFGEAYLAPGSGALMNDVVAVEDSAVIFFDFNRVISVCPSACRFHSLTVRNLFYALSEKNRHLVSRLGIASQRSTRDKLIAYLSEQAKRHNGSVFEIPFNRQQMADYLSVDRSALSSELGRMRDEGMLRFEKNRFELMEMKGEGHS